ncbi:adenine deaminase [Clostridium sp. MSJ-11]|uniref:Adenine deaminase n=1 Tax=Clostridium mobile TaxID=2841512 RepID=A0ABS6ELG1_9CLOT|nr:adenine deaminase [Clostridium mobile]MBU5485863.1 adenine deaminase [Clostridium mobile]
MRIQPKDKKALIEAALGKRECHLVIENANILNLFTGEIYEGDVGIYNGFIAHIECNPDGNVEKKKIKGKEYYDAKGMYLIPGLIDAHIHIESTMMTPRNFAKAVIPHGTTTAVTDPHEIANVLGIEGVKYMHECSKGVPMRQYILAPSCVPAVPGKENAGAEFLRKEIEELFSLDRIIGLGEVMDFLGVINNNPRMVEILAAAEEKGLFIQGHAPFLDGRALSAYLCAGPVSDHESRSQKEVRDKLRVGMYVDARESSISKDIKSLVAGAKDFRYLDNLTVCTDDREPEDIVEAGHVNDVIKQAVLGGLHPIDAIRCATFNSARELGINNLGAIAPGYVADLIITESLEDIKPKAVFFEGDLVAEEGKLAVDMEFMDFEVENRNTVYVKDLTLEDFRIKAPIKEGKVRVNVINYTSLLFSPTKLNTEEIEVKDGYLDISKDENLKFAIVVNRHNGFDTKAYAIIRNFGTKEGAVGSTVSHDCHNITIVYDKPENALMVFNDLKATGGGISCAKDGEALNHLALPVAGLISTKPCEELAKECGSMKDTLRELGLKETPNPLLRIATLALPVIPEVKMSDLGMIEVATQNIIPLFAE